MNVFSLHRRDTLLETERLLLSPLTVTELELWLYNPSELESRLQLVLAEAHLDGYMKTVFKRKIDNIRRDRRNAIWYTYWVIVVKNESAVAGNVGYKHPPNAEGLIEVGYGIAPPFQRRGIMTEALGAFIEWTQQQEGVAVVRAETLKDNHASIRVLRKCGFEMHGETSSRYLWNRELNAE
jgi:RimJ/RimL family protein N-acetyltransferase